MELVRAVALPQRLRALLDHARPVEAQPGGWYELRNAAGEGDTDAELTIYSEIGGWFDSVTAASFAAELGQVTAKNLTLRLSSPGGSVFEGIAIANLLRSHPANVTVVVDGIAASIASVIAIAGDTVIMNPQSQFMIHDALTVAIGNAADMREMAELLDRQSDNIAEAYRARAGGRRDTWRNRMRQETWYSADEAVAAGLADKVAQYPRAAAEPDEDAPDLAAKTDARVWDLSVFRYAGREQAPAPDSTPAPQATADEPEKVAGAQIVINVTGAADLEALAAVMRQVQEDRAELEAMADEPRPEPDGDGQADEPDEPAPDTTPADDGDDWAAATAHLTTTSADGGWAAATAHLTGA